MHRFRAVVIGLFAVVSGSTLASDMSMPVPPPGTQRDWADVEDIQRRSLASGHEPFSSTMGSWSMAPDGRLAIVFDVEADMPVARTAMLGRFAVEGSWLTVEMEAMAIDIESLAPELRAQYDAWMLEAQDAADVVEVDEAASGAMEASETDDAETAAVEDDHVQRYLRVSTATLELLLDEASLIGIASGWSGEGALEIARYAVAAWRAPGLSIDPDDYGFEFRIEDPLQARLPLELSRLLRKDAIEARAIERPTDASAPVWERQTAQVDLRLDRGSNHGMLVDMPVYGIAPDDEFRGKLVEVTPEGSTARFEVRRFSPRDRPAWPGIGMRFTTRSLAAGECPLDFSAAVRAKVQATRGAPAGPEWEQGDFEWLELSIDHGAADGLAVGDALLAEDDEIDGEGRVIGVESKRSLVLWRMWRYHESHEPRIPSADAVLVTPAWQRAEREVFGEELRAAPRSPAG